MDERRAVATRLERFLETFVHGKSADRVGRWKAAAEERLGVKLSVALQDVAGQRPRADRRCGPLAGELSGGDQAARAARSGEAARNVLACWPSCRSKSGRGCSAQLAEQASFFFEHPDLDPDGDLVEKYLDDLARAARPHCRRGAPASKRRSTMWRRTCAARRRRCKRSIEKHYAAALAERLPADRPAAEIPAAAARAALDLLGRCGRSRPGSSMARPSWNGPKGAARIR